jgi:cytochrome c oxidase subunit II
MLQAFQLQASTYAHNIDFVVDLVGLIVTFWFVLTCAAFFFLLWRFRQRDGVPALYVNGTEPDLKRWINVPHYAIIFCDLFIIAAAVRVWYDVKQDMPEPDTQVRLIAQQWAWSFVHPGKDNELGTADDIKTVDELHVELGKVHKYILESRDVLHDFSVPVFRLKQDAIPGREITGWFEPSVAGTYDIQCAEMCGIGHGIMAARIFVETAEEHAAWLEAQSPK